MAPSRHAEAGRGHLRREISLHALAIFNIRAQYLRLVFVVAVHRLSRGVEMEAPSASARRCRADDCVELVPPPLTSQGVCLDHFVELVVRRADQVRKQCLQAQPVDEKTLDWLLADARHVVQALSNGGYSSAADDGQKILELLLCLANLQDYISHHSLHVNRAG